MEGTTTHTPPEGGSGDGCAQEGAPSARFEVRRRLGAGGMGVVYEAFDSHRQAVVALKVLRKISPVGIYRFKREFRALAGVRHRNLVALYELVAEESRWSLSMELIDGVEFMSYVRDGPQAGARFHSEAHELSSTGDTDSLCQTQITLTTQDGSLASASSLQVRSSEAPPAESSLSNSAEILKGPNSQWSGTLVSPRSVENSVAPLLEPVQFDRLRDALRQVVAGVMAVHTAGYLHGDLKPSNVMVDGDGRVAVLDFGIVRELAADGDGPHGRRAGTPAYAAPEMWTDAPCGEASDWYSVGVMLFESLAGQRPFRGRGEDVMAAKLAVPAPVVAEPAPHAPDDLQSLCVALLEREPALRPTGPQILERLGGGELSVPRVPLASAAAGAHLLVGRSQELATLLAAFNEASRGRAQTAFVHGASGLGKSALVDELLRQLYEKSEALVLSGRCYQRESVPHKALDSLIDALTHHVDRLDPARRDHLLPGNIAALARVFPAMARVEVIADSLRDDAGEGDAHDSWRRACSALRSILVGLTRERPVVLCIDDAQWGDLDSARFLIEVLRAPSPPPVLVILGYRTEEAAASQFLGQLQDELPGRLELEVKPLASAEACELGRVLLRQLDASVGLAEPIAREAQGSPLFIAELARYVAVRSTDELGRVSLRDLLLDRVSELAPDARRLLEVLAVAAHPISTSVAVRAAGLGTGGYAAIQSLCAAQLARASGEPGAERLITFHDRIREAVAAELSPEPLRGYHYSLALELDADGQGDAETLAQHWHGAGDSVRAAEHYAVAGRRAGEALAFDRAAELFSLSLELAARSGSERVALLAARGDALANAGRGALAAEAYELAAAESDGDVALGFRSQAAGQLLRGGHMEQGLQALSGVLAELGAPLPKSRTGLLASILRDRFRIRIGGLTSRRGREARRSSMSSSRLDLYLRASTALGYVDPLRGFAIQCQYLLTALRSGDPRHVSFALSCESNFQSFAGPSARGRCQELTQRAQALADELSDPMLQAFAHYGIALAHYQFGEIAVARQAFGTSARYLRKTTGSWWEVCTAEEGNLWCLYYLGEVGELVRKVESLMREAEARGDQYFLTNLCLGRPSLAWLARGDVEGGREAGRQALARWTVPGYQRQHSNALVSETNAYLYAGQYDEAWENLDGQWRQLLSSSAVRIASIRTEAWHLRARASLAAASARSDRAALIKQVQQATKRVARESTEFARALVAVQRAGLARVLGDQEGAVELLRVAVVECEATDLSLMATAARRHLGRLLGGDEGASLVEAADLWMRNQSIVDPERMAAVFVPGFDLS